MTSSFQFSGACAGLGFRREMSDELDALIHSPVQFFEVAPENWLRLGGRYEKLLRQLVERKPVVCHGLSLSIGSPDPLDVEFVKQLKVFFNLYGIKHYSEHLSYCSANGHMYDLMPLPFNDDTVNYVASRIKQVQDILEMPIAMENVSYYLSLDNQLTESEFTKAVLEEANCKLLLDVNNVYVNSINHGYDAKQFLASLPSERIMYGHIAGHYDEANDLKIDTHGADVKQDVWELLEYTYQQHGLFPTLLERDFNIPSVSELLTEFDNIHQIQSRFTSIAKKTG